MLTPPPIGHSAQLTWQVGAHQTIHLGHTADSPGAVVFSTPNMINLMEHAAREALIPYLEPHEESVGVTIDIQHLAPTPIAAAVRAEAKITNIQKKLIDFEITAFDDAEQIGRGTHRRAVINMNKFTAHLEKKSKKLDTAVILPHRITPNPGELPNFINLIVEIEGPIATITLNRPNKLNAVDVQMTSDLERLVSYLAGHPEIRIVILTGAGRSFCSGDDVKEVGTLDIQTATQLSLRQAQMYLAWEQLPQVFIAAVNGDALGGGCCAAYSCDFRIASTTARFGMPEILLGWAPGYSIAQLTAIVGKARAMELVLTGKIISARTATDWGLVNEVVPHTRLLPAAHKLAQALLATPPIALRETKKLVHADEGPQPKIAYLADTAAYIRCLQTEDAKEGITAFSEKRKPQFKGK